MSAPPPYGAPPPGGIYPPPAATVYPPPAHPTGYVQPPSHAQPSMTRCGHCGGKGGLDTWGDPCLRSDMFYKRSCPQCSGNGRVMAGSQQCMQCNGKGNFDLWGDPCEVTSMHRKSACHACQGRGIFAPGGMIAITIPPSAGPPPPRARGGIMSSFFRKIGL